MAYTPVNLWHKLLTTAYWYLNTQNLFWNRWVRLWPAHRMYATFFPWYLAQQQIINFWLCPEVHGFFSFLILRYKLIREGGLCPPAHSYSLLRSCENSCSRRGWSGGFPSHSPLSLQSFAYLLVSCVPYCLCVCIYFQLPLSGSKVTLSWNGPTLLLGMF